ncbi:MAG: hypothetical protein ABI747_03060 [Candidatus Moraniibacteriota bacterium]
MHFSRKAAAVFLFVLVALLLGILGTALFGQSLRQWGSMRMVWIGIAVIVGLWMSFALTREFLSRGILSSNMMWVNFILLSIGLVFALLFLEQLLGLI